MGWTKKPSLYATLVKKAIGRKQRETAVEMVNNLTLNTPVDTGRARANWIVSIGKPSTQILKLESKTGKRAVTRAKKTIEKFNTNEKDLNGDLIFISNNLPYIVYLDKGTDKMRPFNIVEKSLRATANRVGWKI